MTAEKMTMKEKKKAKRVAILDAALEVFSQKGFQSTKIIEVARIANVADGTIYLYFKNKDEIFDACLDPAEVMESFPDFSTLINDHFPENLKTIVETGPGYMIWPIHGVRD